MAYLQELIYRTSVSSSIQWVGRVTSIIPKPPHSQPMTHSPSDLPRCASQKLPGLFINSS